MPKYFVQISVAIFFIVFLIFFAFAPLGQGVPCNGNIVIDTKRKVVQHQIGGKIEEVLVKEGQYVQMGQVLMRLNDLNVRARLEEIKQHYYGLRANEGRLIAELEGKSGVTFHPDLLAVNNDPNAIQHMTNQERMFRVRRDSLNSELATFRESLGEIEAKKLGQKKMLEAKMSQVEILNTQIANMHDLVEQGFASLSQMQEMQIRLGQIKSDIADIDGQMNTLDKTRMVINQKMVTLRESYKKEAEQNLAQVILDVNGDAEKLKALQAELEGTTIKASIAGQVIGMQFQTQGAVIPPGQRIMDIVPKERELIVEAKIEPRVIDKISVGQDVDVRFSNFADMPQLKVEGKLDSISGDSITNPGNQAAISPASSQAAAGDYYLARIKLNAVAMEKLKGRVLQPGMPVQVIVITGERSLLNYLLHPLIKRISASMKEG